MSALKSEPPRGERRWSAPVAFHASAAEVSPAELSLDELRRLIEQVTAARGYSPPVLPGALDELMRLAEDPRADYARVERALSSEPTLAARIVAQSNSAAFSRGTRVDSLRTAVGRLGIPQVRDLAYHAALEAKVFRVPGFQDAMEAEQRHAMATGILCRALCAHLGVNAELAFLNGLLHDIGKPIALGIYADFCRLKQVEPISQSWLHPMVDELHAAIGARVCALWGLPSTLCEAIRSHHLAAAQARAVPMALEVAAADRLARQAGLGRPASPLDEADERSLYQLNLSPDQVKKLIDRAEELSGLLA
jgi:putative nucleotidyltransferase with HDIG domain